MKPHLLSLLAAWTVFAMLSAAQTSRSLDLPQDTMIHPGVGPTSAYVFTSFRGNGETGLHLSWSTNGYDWTPLNPGFNVIDATLLRAEGKYHLFIKDERKNPLKKNLRHAIADDPTGPFGPLSDPITGAWVEGPSAIRIGDKYLLYFDHYTAPHYYGAVRSSDLHSWEDCSREMTFPTGHRHGTILRVSMGELRKLRAWRLQSEHP